jgi:heme exporter protein B
VSGPRVAWVVLCKDLMLDLRSRDRLGHMMVFAAVVCVLLSIALPGVTGETRRWIPTLIWIVFLLTSVLGLSRSFEAEVEGGALATLAQLPSERGWVFLGKALASWLTLVGLQVWTALLFGLFLNVPWASGYPTRAHPEGGGVELSALAAAAALGAGGLSVVGTLFSAIATHARNREFLLPLLLLPLMLPPLVIGSSSMLAALEARDIPAAWWGMLGLYVWVFLLIGYFTFDYVLED